jgi:seryl-tRNA synthetase
LVDTLLTADSLRAEQKAASREVGRASADERPALLQWAKELAEQVKAAEAEQAEAEAAFTAAHMAISNVIIDGVPAGGEDDYTVLDLVGEPAAIDDPKDHLELGVEVLEPQALTGSPARSCRRCRSTVAK